MKPGEIIKKVTDYTKRAGFVIAVGKTREEAVRHVEESIKKIEIEVE